ncbi:helix-turn-helix domain-containing protein [Candidatus Poribacteria bacterium]|nr:helix-turn-helix domain-containing protein [Candidatus Poribacteria bacterium]
MGRPVDLSGINVDELQKWLQKNRLMRKGIVCQAIISLNNGVNMAEVCKVLSVTRESVRLWKVKIRNGGLTGLLLEKKVGKRSKLNEHRKNELIRVIRKSPKKYGYIEKKWTGRLIQEYVSKEWKEKICLRTAQKWLAKIR